MSGVDVSAGQPVHGSPSSELYVPGRVSAGAVLSTALLLVIVKSSLAALGLRRTVRAVKRVTQGRGIETASDLRGVIDRSAQRVAMAAAFYPGRALCLEQSIALYGSLRWAGVDATLRLGVQPHPFKAHAWVEYKGRPIHEDDEGLRAFVPLPEIGR